MKILYPVDAHPLLSPSAKALQSSNQQAFDAHNAMAEALLSLAGTTFSGDDADIAKIAVAFQVNFQLAQGLDPYLSINQNTGVGGSRGTTFRGYKAPPPVHGQALRMVESLSRGTQVVVTSAWTRDT